MMQIGNTNFDFGNKEPMATKKQIELLQDLGVEIPDELTLQEAKEMIAVELDARTNFFEDEDGFFEDKL